jgi:hypothetical protein
MALSMADCRALLWAAPGRMYCTWIDTVRARASRHGWCRGAADEIGRRGTRAVVGAKSARRFTASLETFYVARPDRSDGMPPRYQVAAPFITSPHTTSSRARELPELKRSFGRRRVFLVMTARVTRAAAPYWGWVSGEAGGHRVRPRPVSQVGRPGPGRRRMLEHRARTTARA